MANDTTQWETQVRNHTTRSEVLFSILSFDLAQKRNVIRNVLCQRKYSWSKSEKHTENDKTIAVLTVWIYSWGKTNNNSKNNGSSKQNCNEPEIMVDKLHETWHHYNVLSANRIQSQPFSQRWLHDDKTRTNGRIIMSHIIKDDGLIAQPSLICALSLLLVIMKLSSLLHFYWLLQLKIQSSDARKYKQFPKCHY